MHNPHVYWDPADDYWNEPAFMSGTVPAPEEHTQLWWKFYRIYLDSIRLKAHDKKKQPSLDLALEVFKVYADRMIEKE